MPTLIHTYIYSNSCTPKNTHTPIPAHTGFIFFILNMNAHYTIKIKILLPITWKSYHNYYCNQ